MTQYDSLASRELFIASFVQGRSTKLLSRAMPQLVRALADVHLHEGEALFNVGDVANNVFFVASGRVDVVKNAAHTTYGERSVVGTSDVLLERPRTQDAIAMTELHVLKLPVTSWLEILEDNAEAALGAICGIASNVDSVRIARGALATPDADEDEEDGVFASPEAMTLVDRLLLLRRSHAFRRARIQTLASLASTADTLAFAAGAKLFSASGPRRAHYVVVHGCIETARVDPPRTERYGAGSLVMGAASFAPKAMFDAVAVRDSTVLRIAEEDFFDVSEDHFDLARSLFAWLEEERDELSK